MAISLNEYQRQVFIKQTCKLYEFVFDMTHLLYLQYIVIYTSSSTLGFDPYVYWILAEHI